MASSDVEDEEFFDNDDDEEDDFVPGAGEEDDEPDDDDDAILYLDGVLQLDDEQKVVFQGAGFRLVSTEAAPWNLLDADCRPASAQVVLTLVGPCDYDSSDNNIIEEEEAAAATSPSKPKATPRTLLVTWTVADHSQYLIVSPSKADNVSGDDDSSQKKPPAAGLKGEEDSDEDTKKPAPSSSNGNQKKDEDESTKKGGGPALFYMIYGQEIESSGSGTRLEFRGGYQPLPKGGKEGVKLLAEVRLVPEVASPVAAAAAAPSDDDDDEDAGAVDYDELIALHEDAGLSVDALRKRYRDGGGDNDETNGATKKPAAAAKRGKTPQDDDDDDDDDDVEF